MQEFKFRGWDKEYNRFFKVVEILLGSSGMVATRYPYDDECVEWSSYGMYIGTECEMMQYTEMKDVNACEIYESDVVKIEIQSFIVNEDFIGEVKKLKGRWCVDNGHDSIPLWQETNKVEILGNIYENPELIEGEKQ